MTPWAWLRWTIRIVVGLTTVIAIVFVVTAVRVWQVARQDHRPRADAIVVLGASQFNGRPSQIFQARLDHAKALYDEGVAPRIVTVGGGREGDTFTEAAAGARYLRSAGLPADAVTSVGEGSNTITSLEAAAVRLSGSGVVKIVIVTDPWHSLRARTVARDVGFDAQTSPARTGPIVQSRATEIRYITRETGAYLFYKVFRRSPSRRVPPAA